MENTGSKWANRFIIAAIIQGGIMTAMALVIYHFHKNLQVKHSHIGNVQ